MYQYDILKDTWIYVEIKQLVQEEEHAAYVQEYQQMLQSIVEARFPRLANLTKEVTSQITNLVVLRELIVQVSSAKIEKDARQCLKEHKEYKEHKEHKKNKLGKTG